MSTTFNPESNLYVPEAALITSSSGPEVVTPADFISGYADYADVFEMPREVHEWVAVQLIASALNGRVWIEWGSKYPFDLWVLLLSGSGQGRNTATDVALGVIKEAGIGKLLRKATWGSKAAFFQQLDESPRGLYVWPELSVVLKTLNEPKFAGVKEWITDRYDNLKKPDAITYRRTGKKSKDTPPIVFDEAPRMNILATSSSDWFINNLEQADVAGGFIPRWLPKQVGKSDKVIPKPLAPNPELLPALGVQLAAIAALEGDADLSEIEGQYEEWYREARARFQDQPNAGLAEPFFNRLRGELLKLALIYEVSQSGNLQVSEEAFQRAVAVASDAEETIFKLLPSGMTREGSEVEKMAEKIRSAGPDGITQSHLTKAFQHWRTREREERLKTLLGSGRVHLRSRPTKGRPETSYVHDDYRAKPQDQSEAGEK
jgi:hypothetical protein